MARSKAQDIGDAGEALFDKWARQANLNCSGPHPDRVGVDRVVEVPSSTRQGIPLDRAHPGSVAWFQIKTTAGNRRTWRVSLEVCRRFVFADNPAFFVLIRIDNQEQFRDAYFLHVDQVFGAEVLKELRSVPDGSTDRLHKIEFTVQWEAHHRFRLTHAEVRPLTRKPDMRRIATCAFGVAERRPEHMRVGERPGINSGLQAVGVEKESPSRATLSGKAPRAPAARATTCRAKPCTRCSDCSAA